MMDYTNLFGVTEQKYGLPMGYLSRTAKIESGMNPAAQNPDSSAGGLFQFINSTAQAYGLSDRFDPVQATDAAGRLARDNAAALRSALGREPTAGELYLAHQQGAGGAIALLRNPGALASEVLGGAAHGLNAGKAGQTAGEFAAQWTRKIDGDAGGTAMAAAPAATAPDDAMLKAIYEAFISGRMAPEDAKEYEKDALGGKIGVPQGSVFEAYLSTRREPVQYQVGNLRGTA